MGRSVSDVAENKNMEISGGTIDDSRSVYSVGFPPRMNLASQFAHKVKEMFFADDPLRPYKGQTRPMKFLLGLQYLFPILDWGRSYDLAKLKGDVVSGLTIASLCIPQDIAYAKLANLEPQYALCEFCHTRDDDLRHATLVLDPSPSDILVADTSFVAPLVYAAMGSSRDIAIGPVAVVSLLLGTQLRNEIDPVKNPEDYLRLAFTATFFAGVIQAALGFFRSNLRTCLDYVVGNLVSLLSHPCVCMLQIRVPHRVPLSCRHRRIHGRRRRHDFASTTQRISRHQKLHHQNRHRIRHEIRLASRSSRRKQHYATPFLIHLLNLGADSIASNFPVELADDTDSHSISGLPSRSQVRHIKQGINPSSAGDIYFTGSYATKGLKIGLVAGLVALTVSAGFLLSSCEPTPLIWFLELAGSFSRSAVNYMAGCHTAVSNIVMAATVMLTLLVITPLFKYTPNAVLASIIISAVIGLIDYETAYVIWKVDKLDFLACMGAFFGVVFISVEIGLLIAVRKHLLSS
ncbi:hypothetical protein BHM03_00012253 [Ensete ventricosum]|nr:hypothetical protein BHM03_00012253 [Ensete ventricosum]